MTAIEDAVKVATEEMVKADRARERADTFWAEVARLTLIEWAEKDKRITGLTFESEYEYDDEGGYFLSVNAYPATDGDALELDDYDFHDNFAQFGHASLAILCGVSPDTMDGEVTVEQARERRFQPGD